MYLEAKSEKHTCIIIICRILHFETDFLIPWVVTSTGPGGLMILCVYFMIGATEGSIESGSGEAGN